MMAHLLPLVLLLSACQASPAAVSVNFAQRQDPPLFKKYGVMNSGLVEAKRYNQTMFDALASIRADSFILDLYMGSGNPVAGFRWTIGGFWSTLVDNQAQGKGIESVSFNFDPLDSLARGLHSAGVWPYWAYSYAPDPFQPSISDEDVAAGKMGRCPGFDDDPEHYSCWPNPHEFANCWKCPPKDPDGQGYHNWANVSAVFAQHWRDIGIPVFEEIWNEPDLTEYYDAVTTVTMFLGSSRDYVDTYLAAAHGMRVGDPDAIVGGPGIAYNINTDRRHFPHGQRPNGGDMVIGAANHSQPVDFFSFHVVNPCMDQPGCNITEVFETRAQWSRYALTQPEAVHDSQGGRFNTTELHCTEYFPAVRWVEEMLPFTASPALSILMLNDFINYLGQTDVTKVHWAQFMEVDVASNGTGLVDFQGNARPAFHAFRFWGDLPIERAEATSSLAGLNVASGFSERKCRGSVLLWNNDTESIQATIKFEGMPFSLVDITEWRIDESQPLLPGVELPEVASHSNWPVSNGIFTYPGKNGNLTVPANGTVYLNISASSCWLPSNAANPLPNARVLKKHYYFGFRPALTWLYGEFDSREWAAHLGMGNETHGLALAGANVRADVEQQYTINMVLMDGELVEHGIYGLRVDYWDEDSKCFPPESSLFFYDAGHDFKEPEQVPKLWGSKQDVSAHNFLPRILSNFAFNPLSDNYLVPPSWNGKLSLLFVLKNGTPGTKVRSYIRGPPAAAAHSSFARLQSQSRTTQVRQKRSNSDADE